MPAPLVKLPAQAFVSSPVFLSPRTCLVQVQRKPVLKRARRPTHVRACIQTSDSERSPLTEPAEETPSTSASRTRTKTEEIAALLGQDKEELEAKAEKVRQTAAADNRYKYGLAFASVAISSALFFVSYLDPNSDVNLMHFLAESSAPVEVIGKNGKPTVIEFSATWCENCKFMARRVFELENEYSGKVNFVVIDGEDPGRQEIVEKYGVDAIPQFSMVSKDGKVLTNLVGLVPKQVLASDLEALVSEETLPFKGLSIEELNAAYS